jgi:hypothetical protein
MLIPDAALRTNAVVEFKPILVGSVGCKTTPVSPLVPFKVTNTVLAAGNTIVQPVALLGGVIVLFPVDNA